MCNVLFLEFEFVLVGGLGFGFESLCISLWIDRVRGCCCWRRKINCGIGSELFGDVMADIEFFVFRWNRLITLLDCDKVVSLSLKGE